MPFEYLNTDEAISRSGLRGVMVRGTPSPWGEAVKGMLHMKGIDWAAVYLDAADEGQVAWSGSRSAPVMIYNDEPPVEDWKDILLLLERLAPTPAMLPEDAAARDQVLQLCEAFFGAEGLGKQRRLQLVDLGLQGQGGFPEPIAKYLGQKYGHDAASAAAATGKIVALLNGFADQLKAQQAAGNAFYVGDTPTAADVYSATCLALLRPLPEAQCTMHPAVRGAFETPQAETDKALDPILLAHRDMMYETYLELPLAL